MKQPVLALLGVIAALLVAIALIGALGGDKGLTFVALASFTICTGLAHLYSR